MPAACLEDWFAINMLFTRYATALDRCDVDAVVDCFGEQGSLESPVLGVFQGPARIREFAEMTARLKREHGAQFRHVVSNLQVDVDGDRARATCYLLDFVTRDGVTELLSPGEYECDLTRSDGRWRFDFRLVRMDRPFVVRDIQ
jgi:ketosteroid isomerase-like protein